MKDNKKKEGEKMRNTEEDKKKSKKSRNVRSKNFLEKENNKI